MLDSGKRFCCDLNPEKQMTSRDSECCILLPRELNHQRIHEYVAFPRPMGLTAPSEHHGVLGLEPSLAVCLVGCLKFL